MSGRFLVIATKKIKNLSLHGAFTCFVYLHAFPEPIMNLYNLFLGLKKIY